MLEQVIKNAIDGRGLWLGVFTPESVHRENHPVAQMLPDYGTAHVTLFHFGKANTEDRVRAIASVVERFWAPSYPGELTGVGWFWRRNHKHTRVAIVNSGPVCKLYAMLAPQLPARDDRFGFVPHVTLKDDLQLADLCVDTGEQINRGLPCTFGPLTLVCGDARLAAESKF